MNHINQFITRTNLKKFEEIEITVKKPSFKPLVAIKRAYNSMNEFFGLEDNTGAQIVYYGICGGALLMTISLKVSMFFMGY